MNEIEEAYKKYSKMVYLYLLSKTCDDKLAEELTQETFFQAVKSIDKFKNESSITTWLCAIAGNVWKKNLRDKKDAFNIDDVKDNLETATLENNYIEKIKIIDTIKKIHDLKEPSREVIYLRLIGNLSFKEIGEVMGQSENWARIIFYRGKQKIIEEVNKDE